MLECETEIKNATLSQSLALDECPRVSRLELKLADQISTRTRHQSCDNVAASMAWQEKAQLFALITLPAQQQIEKASPQADVTLPLGCLNGTAAEALPSLDCRSLLRTPSCATASVSSLSPYVPFEIVQAPLSFLAQNEPPGCKGLGAVRGSFGGADAGTEWLEHW